MPQVCGSAKSSFLPPKHVLGRQLRLPAGLGQYCACQCQNSLLATHRAVAAKHLPRYLGAFAWRFNRRFVLKTIYERLAVAAAATPPMPYRFLKLAEARW